MQNNPNLNPQHSQGMYPNPQFQDNTPNPYQSLAPPYDPTPVIDNHQYQNSNPQYPAQNAPYQQPNPSYPQQNAPYQHPNPSYPQQNAPYQQPNPSYPQQNAPYQQPNPSYPQPNAPYQQTNPTYPQPNYQYQQQNPPYSQPNGQHPPQSSYPPQYPPQNGVLPPSSAPNNNYPNYQPQQPPYANYQHPPVTEPLVDGPCTYNRTHKHSMRQPFYNCITCGLVNGLGCCEACARICHEGHQLVPKGVTDCYCDCGAGKTKSCVHCRCLKVPQSQAQYVNQFLQQTMTCTFVRTGRNMAKQQLFTCVTCRMRQGECICESCAKVCHAGHDVRPFGRSEGFCDCGAGAIPGMRCKCMIGEPGSYSGSDCCLQ